MPDEPMALKLLKCWLAFLKWRHRLSMRTESERKVFDLLAPMADLQLEREYASQTQPKVGIYLDLPAGAIWAEGIRFDRPDLTLPWTFTKDEFKRSISGGTERGAGEVGLWGLDLWCSVAYSEAFLWPHRGETISAIFLTGREREEADVLSNYHRCAEKLSEIFGPPACEQEMERSYWPAHTRRGWETPFLRVWHSIASYREGPPNTRLVIERKYSRDYLGKYPKAGQGTKWD
jgi:hypothetical protein